MLGSYPPPPDERVLKGVGGRGVLLFVIGPSPDGRVLKGVWGKLFGASKSFPQKIEQQNTTC